MERVIRLISEVGGIKIVPPDVRINEAGFSSVRVLDLLLTLEQEFDVRIPDEDFIAAGTPRRIAELIERLREKQEA
ncbi:MAG TPA: acyl carrier protein [Candidatus Limnocylindrales bacterium]|nr:acyl carrier protein [Candidatus Limnocylindrales bacterium]